MLGIPKRIKPDVGELEIVYEVEWKTPGNDDDKAKIIGILDTPDTNLDWNTFKSYLVRIKKQPLAHFQSPGHPETSALCSVMHPLRNCWLEENSQTAVILNPTWQCIYLLFSMQIRIKHNSLKNSSHFS